MEAKRVQLCFTMLSANNKLKKALYQTPVGFCFGLKEARMARNKAGHRERTGAKRKERGITRAAKSFFRPGETDAEQQEKQ